MWKFENIFTYTVLLILGAYLFLSGYFSVGNEDITKYIIGALIGVLVAPVKKEGV